MELRDATRGALPAEVHSPTYDRTRLRCGIVHAGVGHFHRAHQALYLDELFSTGAGHDWAVCGVGVMPDDVAMRDALRAQDGLYTLTPKTVDGAWNSRVIGSIPRYLYAPDNPQAVIDHIADPATRIVSLTITEGGYDIDNLSGEFLGASQPVLADLAAQRPLRTVFGLVLEAAKVRREAGVGGFTVMSCDNIQENGRVARAAFLGFAQRKDPDLAQWMVDHLSFPNGMVDRVTPKTVDADRTYLRDRHGYVDRWPVTCEPFRQWVLEDDFAAGRPPYEEVGVEMVSDVRPYESMKLRLANGTHQALCYVGHLLGHRYVHEAIADPDVRALLNRYQQQEAIGTMSQLPGVDFSTYGRTVIERFGNPEIRDTLARICEDTSDRIPKFVLPVVFGQLARGGSVTACATVVAAWARYAEGTDEQGEPIDVRDPLREELMSRAFDQHHDPLAFLRHRAVFGDLVDRPEFTRPYLAALDLFHRSGTRAVLQSVAEW